MTERKSLVAKKCCKGFEFGKSFSQYKKPMGKERRPIGFLESLCA